MEYDWSPPPISQADSTPAQLLAREGMENRVYRRWDKAADAYEKLLKLEPNNADAASKLAQCQMGMEKWEDALGNFKRAQDLGEDETFLLPMIARAQLGAKRNEDAAKSYEQAIARGQDSVNNVYNLACAFALTNQKEKALDTLKAALAKGPYMKAEAAKDEDFASIREDERFKAMVGGK
jgi:tetratricopeptide (TPR) repeat protein